MPSVKKALDAVLSARAFLIAGGVAVSVTGWAYGLGAQRSANLPARLQRHDDTIASITRHLRNVDDTIASLSDHVIQSDSAVLAVKIHQGASDRLLDSIARVATKSWCVVSAEAKGRPVDKACFFNGDGR